MVRERKAREAFYGKVYPAWRGGGRGVLLAPLAPPLLAASACSPGRHKRLCAYACASLWRRAVFGRKTVDGRRHTTEDDWAAAPVDVAAAVADDRDGTA